MVGQLLKHRVYKKKMFIRKTLWISLVYTPFANFMVTFMLINFLMCKDFYLYNNFFDKSFKFHNK